ncbi:DegT/DnrJ/EryC1/StrS family aminotransferase [Polluticoccus soli]|uniref:DegT/DnrJ/EryC1/StrS family aminotransferase n=1 Tax=Polluticoccus soli TaxID=3034150 RepID=UPI0023E100EA|nr:DegT/DnrJ/EryC1/StrS family aminotransferase [Flavipsychrobacter sp. JY13-12]
MSLLTEKITALSIPFSPPFIDEDVISEVVDTLRSGWITTGPKVKQLETLAKEFIGCKQAVCVNSWTSGATLTFKWLGIGPGDEIIIPAYTYAATALTVIHAGATPIMVDVLEDCTIDPEAVKKAITPRTKAILAVDFGGWPCNYTELLKIVTSPEVKTGFTATNAVQQNFARPIVIADAAHSLGAQYGGAAAALAADLTIFSLHAVKNITTAEGGLISLSLPEPFDNEEVYHWMKLHSLNGQTKDAFAKSNEGAWKYDIVTDGLKINMTDVCAAMGLAQLRKYRDQLLPARKEVFGYYSSLLSEKEWAMIPACEDDSRVCSYHLFPLRIRQVDESQRDRIIKALADKGIATNVHFIPLPMLTLFKNMGFKIGDFPVAYRCYANEISLPLYPTLSFNQCVYIAEQLEKAYLEVI